MKFILYTDPKHGWLKVPVSVLEKFKVHRKISNCSYLSPSKEFAYLEEDSDAMKLLKALHKENIEIVIVPKHNNKQSHIRRYPRYRDHYFNWTALASIFPDVGV
tara:strand:- start:121 stop:432 length:312 start_codon:yes stop_codon:yes gene_type:complete